MAEREETEKWGKLERLVLMDSILPIAQEAISREMVRRRGKIISHPTPHFRKLNLWVLPDFRSFSKAA
jgi:hypothetical protein